MNIASVSGATIPTLSIKLLMLKKRKQIDMPDFIELVGLLPEITARLVKPDARMSWMPLDEIDLHQFSPVDNERFRAALANIRGEELPQKQEN